MGNGKLIESTTVHVVQEQGKEAAKDILFGSTAGIVGKFIEYPFDTVKVRLQSQPDGIPPQYKGPIDCFRQSWRADGIAGLYRGISAPLVGAAVETSSLFFSVCLIDSNSRWTHKLTINAVPSSPRCFPCYHPPASRSSPFLGATRLWCHLRSLHISSSDTNRTC